jgi:hypothetical protein
MMFVDLPVQPLKIEMKNWRAGAVLCRAAIREILATIT